MVCWMLMPIRGLAMTGYLCAFLGLSKSWGSCQCTGGFAEQVMSWILALAPQGPATGFLKFCFLELFISCVLPWEKCHCCHTSLGTHSLAGTPQLWEVGSGGSLAVLPSRDEGIGGCIPLLPPPQQCQDLILSFLPASLEDRLPAGRETFPWDLLALCPIPPAATSQS